MKTTVLIYKEIEGVRKLVVATKEEWDAILKANKRLPDDEKRWFELSCIEENGELDRMYIEITGAEHRTWNSRNTISQRNRKNGTEYLHVSLDTTVQDLEISSLHETVPSEFDLERLVTDCVLYEELYMALQAWKPWATEMLAIYMKGNKRTCTSFLSKKYGLKERAVRQRKEQFEEFVINFLK